MLTSAQRQKLAYQKLILKYSNDFIEEDASDNLLGDNLLGNNPLNDNNPAYIDSNINMDIKVKSNPNENITNNNFLEKNFKINIEDLF